ncbi:MAG: hypothetical protein QOE90_1114 [Thermoplasmata archaeon]|nr:hypothetical protein [Thermoplasmata archaeon]
MRLWAWAIVLTLAWSACAGGTMAATAAGAGLSGTWTWSSAAGQQTENGTLALETTGWTLDLPEAIVGCKGGLPSYEPKVMGTPIVETFPPGACSLHAQAGGDFVYWATGATAGPRILSGWGTFQ